jgi:hypothetical protein
VRRALALLVLVACTSTDRHLAPGFAIKEASYPEAWQGPQPISARRALRSAVSSLEARGVRDIRLCSIDWIVAPLGGAIIHALGRWENGGVSFRAFAVGIHDGTEVNYGLAGGAEFFVLARGVDARGVETYYYSGGERPVIFPYTDIAEDTDKELMFELVSREALAGLPVTCGAP